MQSIVSACPAQALTTTNGKIDVNDIAALLLAFSGMCPRSSRELNTPLACPTYRRLPHRMQVTDWPALVQGWHQNQVLTLPDNGTWALNSTCNNAVFSASIFCQDYGASFSSSCADQNIRTDRSFVNAHSSDGFIMDN